ncbi:MAG: hypothetical protein ACK5N8_04955 [Alphaproteobacteria bacterium]
MTKIVSTFIFLSLFCIKSNSVFAEEVSCEDIVPQPEINFQTSYGNLVYDRSKTKEELTEVGGEFGVVEKGLFAAGLSTVKINWEISVDTINRVSNEGGEVCIIPMKLNLYIGYEDPVIYISKGLQENTCEYNMVLRHEQAHQQINVTALEHFVAKIRDVLPEVSKEVGAEKTTSLRELVEVNNKITKAYIAQIEPMVKVFKAELKKEQSKLDNMENYQMEGEICKKETK